MKGMVNTNETTSLSLAKSNSRPILIIGPPRSGTTLLTTMLNAHPNIFMANEAKVFVRMLPYADKYPSPVDKKTANSIIDRLENQELHYLNPLPTVSEILPEHADIELATFIRSLFEALAYREGKKRWGEKTAVAYRQLNLICKSYPDAQLLALDRDPYEIAASYKKINPKWGALGAIIHWLDFKRAVAREVSPKSKILIVSYEKLVASPEPVLRKICDHIGEEYNSAMLDFYKTKRANSLASDKTYEGPARPLYRSPEPPDYLRQGLRGLIIRHLISSAALIERRPTVIYLIVKAWIYVRVVLWEIKHKIQRNQL